MIPVTVTFYGDVGFDRSYNHVIDFSNETQRESYFTPKILKTIENCAYNKPMNSIQIRCNYEEALSFTYCKFIMGSNSSHQKKIFAWVDDVILKTDQKDENGNYLPVLEVNIAIDPWQSFLFDFTIGESFVAREHVDRFKANNDGTRGWTLGNTSDVGNVGLEKRKTKLATLINKHNFYKWAVGGTIGNVINDDIYFLCVQATAEHSTNIRIIFIPIAKEQYCIGDVVNTDMVCGRTLDINNVYDGSYLSALGIGSDYVASVCYIPFDIYNYNGIVSYTDSDSHTYNVAKISLKFSGFTPHLTTSGGVANFVYYEKTLISQLNTDNIPMIYSVDITTTVTGLTKPVNNVYSDTHEPQLYKQPYRYVSIIDNSGGEKGTLPDIMANIENQAFTLRFYLLIDSVDVRLRIVPIISNIEMSSEYWIEFALSFVDVVSTNWLNYMLQQRDADRAMIQSQINQKAIASAVGGASSSVSMGGNQTLNAMRGELNNPAMVGGAYAGVGLGAAALQTLGGYLTDAYFCFEQQDIREKAIKRKANNVISNGTFKSMIDGAINIYLVECDETTLNIKAKEFHKYGYSVFFYETPNVKSRKYFNFIATSLVKIEGSLNNNIKMALMEIFNHGVTIWHGDYISELTGIGDYSKENIERSLL